MKHIFFSLLLIGVFASCTQNKILTEISVDTSRPILSDEKIFEIKSGVLSSLIDSLLLVPLDETHLVGNIKRICHSNGMLYILADDQLLLFDDNGKFVKVIAVKGQGPEEVLDFCDYDVDSTGIIILDPVKFLFFDINGNPTKTIHNDFGYGRISLLPGGKGWVLKAVEPTENNHTLIAFDNSGDTVFSAVEPYEFEFSWLHDLFHLNDSILLNPVHPSGGNEIIALDIEQQKGYVIPVTITGDPMSAKDFEDAVRTVGKKTDVPKLSFWGFSDNQCQLFFSAFKSGKTYRYVYDKYTGYVLRICPEVENDLTVDLERGHVLGMIFRTSSDDDYFVTWMSDPQETYKQSNRLNPRFKPEYEKLATIDDDSNPVIAFIKFKSPAKFLNENK